MAKSRRSRSPRVPFTEVDVRMLIEHYPDTSTALLAEALGRPVDAVYRKANHLGLRKSEAFLASEASGRLQKGAHPNAVVHQFKKGHVPANKGLRRPGWSAGRMQETQFPKGNRPHTWVPVGTYRVNRDGHLELKTNDAPGPYYVRWKPVHRLVWIEANGEIPEGHVVAFKPGRKTTDPALITLDAIELISKRENMARNTVHNLPPTLVQVVRLRGAINRQINKRSKEKL